MTEQKLIQQSIGGDINSFSQLIEIYQDTLACYLLTQTRNKEDTEDIVQETFISAHKYLKSYNPQWKFKTWLFTIARRLLYNYYKKIKEVDYTLKEPFDSIDDSFIDNNNIWLTIKRIVSQQSFDVLWFFYSEELSIKEIAKILQCTQSWVKMSMFRSKRKLAKNKEIESFFNDLIIVG